MLTKRHYSAYLGDFLLVPSGHAGAFRVKNAPVCCHRLSKVTARAGCENLPIILFKNGFQQFPVSIRIVQRRFSPLCSSSTADKIISHSRNRRRRKRAIRQEGKRKFVLAKILQAAKTSQQQTRVGKIRSESLDGQRLVSGIGMAGE